MVKLYQNGIEFYQDNKQTLEENPLDTSFMLLNSKVLTEFSEESYAFKVYNDACELLVLRVAPFTTVLFGDKNLCSEAIEIVLKYHLNIDRILASSDLSSVFYDSLIEKIGGSYKVHHKMDIMFATHFHPVDTSMVKRATKIDVDRIFALSESFSSEISVDDELAKEERLNRVKNTIQDYYYIEENQQIVSMAKKTRNEEKMCAITSVYTKTECRCKGYARKVVTKVTKDIIDEHKIAYLYVDKSNPISNHLYVSIGYAYGNSKYELRYFHK